MMVNNLGDGLHLFIKANRSYSGDWMSFCCWYSLTKLLPDTKISLLCQEKFKWAKKMNIPIVTKDCGIIIEADTVAVRELTDDNINHLNSGGGMESLCCLAQENVFLPFTSYKNGCGNFVTAEWIHKKECPFPLADRFMTDSATANEIRVLKLWRQLNTTYATVSR